MFYQLDWRQMEATEKSYAQPRFSWLWRVRVGFCSLISRLLFLQECKRWHLWHILWHSWMFSHSMQRFKPPPPPSTTPPSGPVSSLSPKLPCSHHQHLKNTQTSGSPYLTAFPQSQDKVLFSQLPPHPHPTPQAPHPMAEQKVDPEGCRPTWRQFPSKQRGLCRRWCLNSEPGRPHRTDSCHIPVNVQHNRSLFSWTSKVYVAKLIWNPQTAADFIYLPQRGLCHQFQTELLTLTQMQIHPGPPSLFFASFNFISALLFVG